MKILWISPTPSHPQNAGNRAHIYAMGKEMVAAGHDITFLCYGQESVGEEDRIQMAAFWTRFVYVPHRLHSRKKSQGTMWGIDDWFNIDLESAVRFLVGQESFDVAYCEYVFFSKALTLFPAGTLKVLSCHDRMSDRAEMLARQGIAPDFFYTSTEQEKIALDRADLVVAIQEDEQRFFQSLTHTAVIEVGYPVQPQLLPQRQWDGKLRVGYLGSNNSLNRKSVESFLFCLREDIELREKVEVVLAGTICNAITDPDVSRLGVVDDEAELYRAVDLAINPMVDGTGLKIKSLSAIRHGTPLVATLAGGVGLPLGLDEHLFPTVADMVGGIRAVSHDPQSVLVKMRADSEKVLRAYMDRHKTQVSGLLRAIATRSVRHLSRKNVLVVTDVPFWEVGVGSHSRILALCRALQQRFTLTVFFFGSLYPERRVMIDSAGFSGQVVSYKDYEPAGKNVSIEMRTPDYPGLKKWRHESFARSLRAFVASRPPFDAVVFEYLWMAYTRDALVHQQLTVLDLHDLMAYRDYRFSSQGVQVGVSISFREELEILDNFDAVIAIQHEEAETLQRALKSAIALCCPHGVDIVEAGSQMTTRGPEKVLRLGFGGAASVANVEALQWFLRQVWPVVAKLPITLHVFGRVCDKFADEPPAGVQMHGVLQRLDDAYALFDVLVNPVFHGGGIKIKSIEALAYGKPLIASPEGAVGIGAPERSGVLVAASRADFIEHILLLAKQPELVRKLALDARRAAHAQFSPQASFTPLLEMIECL